MRESEPQRPVSAHGYSADRASRTAGANAVFAFDMRHELLQEEIAVPYRPICGVDVKTAPALGRYDQEITHLVLLAQIVQQCPSPAVEERPLVVAQPMQKVNHGIALRGLLACACVVSRWQVNAVVHDLLQNAAVQCGAINSALGGGSDRHNDKRQENDPMAKR